MKSRQVYIFGNFALDPTAKVLFRAGQPVHLARKAVETLLVLVENPSQVMTKEEIIQAVWGDRVVEEANLAQNIAVIRKALAAEHGSPAWIETFPGRGYRLEGPVSTSTLDQPATLSHDQEAPATPARARWIAPVAAAAVCCLAIVWFVWFRPLSPPATPLRISPITRLPGKEFQPAISPGGDRVAFLWSRGGATPPSVWVKPVAGGSASELLPAGGHHSSPAWSPDGQRLALLRIGRAASQVVVVEIGSGSQRIVTALSPPDYGYDFRLLEWSPDGQTLAVSHSDGPDRPLAITLIALPTGEKRSLTQPPGNVLGDVDPRFSPDGKTVSFIRLIHRFHQEVYTVPLAGGPPARLTGFDKQISGHDWETGGKSILFGSDHSGEFRVWRIEYSPAGPAGKPTPAGIYGEFPIQLAAARNSSALVYSVLRQDRNIWRLDLASKSWERVIASTGQDASPQFSPTGDFISFRSDRSGEEQLWITKPDGSEAAQVTSGPLHPSVGRWSPDGRAIVFNNPQTAEIHVADLNQNGSWSVRSAGASGVHPVFSRDGKWIYAGGPSGITRLPAAGGAASTITRIRSLSLDISPDGQFIYYVREPIDTSLWRLNLATLAPEKVLEGLVPGCTSCWALAPDGVFYLGTGKESLDTQILYFHDLKTRSERAILPYPEPLWPLGSGPFALSPDRRSLLCVRMDPSDSDIMLAAPSRP